MALGGVRVRVVRVSVALGRAHDARAQLLEIGLAARTRRAERGGFERVEAGEAVAVFIGDGELDREQVDERGPGRYGEI